MVGWKVISWRPSATVLNEYLTGFPAALILTPRFPGPASLESTESTHLIKQLPILFPTAIARVMVDTFESRCAVRESLFQV